MIKGILIDIDNTLYDYDSAHKTAISAVADFASDFTEKDLFFKSFEKARLHIHNLLKDTASSHNRLLYFQKTLEFLKIKNYMAAKKMYDIYWDVFLKNMKLYNGVIDFLKKYKPEQICFVTDLTAYIQYRKIEFLKLEKYVGNLVTSEEAGIEKPDGHIFELALSKLNLKANEVCMIGDSFEKDYLGAKACGIKPILFNPKKEPVEKGVIEFSDFKELTGIIK